jgi:CO/xanthine dehydrogenase Mo-binding subunit
MFGDRCTYWDGNATIAAANDLKRQLAVIAAKELQASPEDLEFKNRRIFVKGKPEKGIDFLLAVRRAYYERGEPLYGKGYWAATDIDIVDWKTGKGNLVHGLDFIATAIEVDVDRETGKVKLLRPWGRCRATDQPGAAGRAGEWRQCPHDRACSPRGISLR